ncbi:hypothetical protein OPV22_027221 [Ensete ventricosum]|uniref:WRKY domain-containing protein n=1 Tax=Ensete ventricosum TaxID=4639 RepID=A0AAV8PZG7_ENSVE|nr:hypothetical protein OPV22_027221 [Ensete ventricosum]
MEQVQEANKAAVGSCHRVLSLLSQSQDQDQSRKLAAETGEAVAAFKRVVSLLSDSGREARFRTVNKVKSPSDHKLLSNEVAPKIGPSLTNSQLLPRDALDNNDGNANDLLQLSQRSFLENQKPGQDPSSAHRRFLPPPPQQQQNNQTYQLQQQMNIQADMLRRNTNGISIKFDSSNCTPSASTSMDGKMTSLEGKVFHLIEGHASSSPVKPHPPPKKTCKVEGEDKNGKCANSGRCRCSRRRKLRLKRSIKVPAVSEKLADIPPDDYPWRKYGQKPIKGSPHPRGYYKCSSIRGCAAKKHVERCLEDPSMLVVTYEGEHSHTKFHTQSTQT